MLPSKQDECRLRLAPVHASVLASVSAFHRQKRGGQTVAPWHQRSPPVTRFRECDGRTFVRWLPAASSGAKRDLMPQLLPNGWS